MKLIKYILVFFFFIMLLGTAFKTVVPYANANDVLLFGVLGYILVGMVYIVLALINKQNRIAAGMIGLSLPITLGLLLSSFHLPFGSVQLVIFSPIITVSGIVLLIYSIVQQRNIGLATLYLTTGFGCLFFTFKYLLWPGSIAFFILAAIGMIVSVILLFVIKQKATTSVIILLLVNILFCLVFFISKSTMYRYKHLNIASPESNFADNYHRYAWFLYKDGKIEEAKTNLKYAIYLVKVSRPELLEENPEASIERYERAMESLRKNNWMEAELPVSMQ